MSTQVDIIRIGDWAAIYIDGAQVHCHDTPSIEQMLDLVGIECTSRHAEDILSAEDLKDIEFSMPNTIGEFNELVRESQLRVKQRERDEFCAKLRQLEQELRELEQLPVEG